VQGKLLLAISHSNGEPENRTLVAPNARDWERPNLAPVVLCPIGLQIPKKVRAGCEGSEWQGAELLVHSAFLFYFCISSNGPQTRRLGRRLMPQTTRFDVS
jgi:hypothetical protein